MRRAARLALLALLLASPAAAQQGQPVFLPIVSLHDFDSSTATYCVLGQMHDSSLEGVQKITTSGSATVTTAVSGTPFDNIAAGSELTVIPASGAGQALVRYVVTKADGDEIAVHVAWTLPAAGTAWSWRNLTCGTGAQAGWFPVGGLRDKTLVVQVDQISLASGDLVVKVQCKGSSPWAVGVQVYPPLTGAVLNAAGTTAECIDGAFSAVAACAVYIPDQWASCRVSAVLTDDAVDTGANLERVTFYLQAVR